MGFFRPRPLSATEDLERLAVSRPSVKGVQKPPGAAEWIPIEAIWGQSQPRRACRNPGPSRASDDSASGPYFAVEVNRDSTSGAGPYPLKARPPPLDRVGAELEIGSPRPPGTLSVGPDPGTVPGSAPSSRRMALRCRSPYGIIRTRGHSAWIQRASFAKMLDGHASSPRITDSGEPHKRMGHRARPLAAISRCGGPVIARRRRAVRPSGCEAFAAGCRGCIERSGVGPRGDDLFLQWPVAVFESPDAPRIESDGAEQRPTSVFPAGRPRAIEDSR